MLQQTHFEMVDINDIKKPNAEQDSQQIYCHPGNFAEVDQRTLQLTGILQSTLELNKILELFGDEIASMVPHDGLIYENKAEDYLVQFGEKCRNRCSYKLTLLDKNVGELALYRDIKFTDEELNQLEIVIAALIYPIRNSLLYKSAIEKAHRDPVTGVNNRTAMDSNLEQELKLAQRHSHDLSIILVDIDHFKQINDTYGHIAGDTILKRVAECMTECVRDSDAIYRYGGEEFLILLRNTNKPGAQLLAERIRQAIEDMYVNYDEFNIKVTASAGISKYKQSDTMVSLVERCDNALYQAKEQGRNRVVTS